MILWFCNVKGISKFGILHQTFTLRNSQLFFLVGFFFFLFKLSWNIKTFQLLFIILERFRSSLRRHVQELNTNQLNTSSSHAKIRNTLNPYVSVFTDFYHMKLSFQGYYTNPQSHPNEAHLPLSQVWSLCKFQAAGIGSGLMGSHVHVCLCRLFLLYKVAVKSSKKRGNITCCKQYCCRYVLKNQRVLFE